VRGNLGSLGKAIGMTEFDRLRMGGLMRCCTGTVEDLYPGGPARIAVEGQTLQCAYAPDDPLHRMIFRDGAWEWDPPQDPA
jgi:hypothetical protein